MALVGNIVGGWMVRRGNLNVKKTLYIVLFGILVTLAVSITLFFFVGNRLVHTTSLEDKITSNG